MPRARGGSGEGGRQAVDDDGVCFACIVRHLAAHNSRAGVAFLRQILADAVDADWAASEERAARRKRVPGREEGAATEVVAPWLPPSPNTSDYCPSNGAFEFCPVFREESRHFFPSGTRISNSLLVNHWHCFLDICNRALSTTRPSTPERTGWLTRSRSLRSPSLPRRRHCQDEQHGGAPHHRRRGVLRRSLDQIHANSTWGV